MSNKSTGFSESAKSRTWHDCMRMLGLLMRLGDWHPCVFGMLMCLHAWCASVPACVRACLL